MSTMSNNETDTNAIRIRRGIMKRSVSIALFMVITMVILLTTSGRIDWIWAWVYFAICLVVVLINRALTLRKNPATIAERGNAKLTQTWDKVIAGIYSFSLNLMVPIIAGLDVRFGWSRELGLPWHILGAVMLAAALELSGWSMVANAYFSTAIRIQSERGHTVCTTGPYRFVRHPGYVGFIVQSLFIPILFGSLWALIPAVVAASCIVVRTVFEDRILQAELPGYSEYTKKVKYRLLPGIW
jgi:protein-S-isoprenylcysteine O-methyltransferase Ste14